jgi:hypothetical protein
MTTLFSLNAFQSPPNSVTDMNRILKDTHASILVMEVVAITMCQQQNLINRITAILFLWQDAEEQKRMEMLSTG